MRPMAASPTVPSLWPKTTASAISLRAHPRDETIAGAHRRRYMGPVKRSCLIF